MKDNLTRRAALGTVGVAGLAALAATVLTPSRAAAEHPHLHKALDELRGAKEELETTDYGFKGHKKEAIEAIKVAIEQVKILIDNE